MHESKFLVGITNSANSIDKIVMTNCNVEVTDTDTGSSTNRYIIHTGANTTAIKEINITDNIFYTSNQSSPVANFRVLSGNTYSNEVVTNATAVDKLVFDNNTLVNIKYANSALIVANKFSSASIQKNLVYCDQTVSNKNNNNFMIATTEYPTEATCSDNIVYDINIVNGKPAFKMFYHANEGLGQDPEILSVNPFEGGDLSTFTPSTEFAEYGAQR